MGVGQFADRSSGTIEGIKQLESLGKKRQEIDAIEQKAERDLKRIEDVQGQMRRRR